MKKSIDTLSKLKKKYPSLYNEIKEHFVDHKKKLSNFELDYFVFKEKTNEFMLSLSSGIADELEIFDMSGEMIDEEVSVNKASFDRSFSKEDMFDTESPFIKEMLDEDEFNGDTEY